MRVLIVHDYGTLVGGAEHMSVTLRDGLRERGHEALIFASSAEPLRAAPIADLTCFGTQTLVRRVTQVVNPMAAYGLRRAIREFAPDVVHCRMFMTQLSPMILPELRGVPALLHVVNYDLVCPLNTKLLPDGSPCTEVAGAVCRRRGCLDLPGSARAWAHREMWRSWGGVFDAVIANSHAVRDTLVREGVRVDGVVWNGAPTRPQRPPLQGPPTVAFAGRFVPKKGVDVLIRAMARVVTEIPEARLILAGDGPERSRLEFLVNQHGLTDRVEFIGFVDRPTMEARFASAWVQAVPSTWSEPFGIVVAEAMMRGTAAVVTCAGGPGEVVQEGETGLRVDPGDSDALASALLRLLSDREEAERMGAIARRFALDKLTEARVIDQFQIWYAKLIEGSAGDASHAHAASFRR